MLGMKLSNKERIKALLKSIETGDPGPVAVVNEDRYIQHNPQTHEGSEGLAALFQRLSKTSPRVNIVRAFEDGEFVFAHTEYDFSRRNIGFEVFRFKDGRAVEHWDNIQARSGPNPSGRSMVDGPIDAIDHELTETNRSRVQSFLEIVLIEGQLNKIADFIDEDTYIEHNPQRTDGISSLRQMLNASNKSLKRLEYRQLHRVLAEGNFVLGASEGSVDGTHSAFYDLFRVADGMIVEHWDTIEAIAPRSEWKNNNGKF